MKGEIGDAQRAFERKYLDAHKLCHYRIGEKECRQKEEDAVLFFLDE
jgi:hypothetical protein